MKIAEKSILFAGEEMVLTNQRVLYWPRKKTLLLSDIHIGKSAHFRKHGVAIPQTLIEDDLKRLTTLIEHFSTEKVIIVGDIIHAGANTEVELFTQFAQQFTATKFILIKGNHDKISFEKLLNMGIHEIYDDLFIDGILLTHEPDDTTHATISGHVHPGVSITMPTKNQMRFPCFVVTHNQIILPAFSTFTGLDTNSIPENAVCYALHKEGIFMVN